MYSPAAPIIMSPISHIFTVRMILALSRMSASCPASAERIKNGRMNKAEARLLKLDSVVSSL